MSEHWKRIIKSQYDLNNRTAEEVQAFVPRLITQTECDEILGV